MTFFIDGGVACYEFNWNTLSIYNCLLEFVTMIQINLQVIFKIIFNCVPD